jgi:hypothetical protein
MNVNVDQELENNPEYRRILAALPPDDRLRFFGLDFNLERQLVKKREYRRALSKLSPAEKIRLLEELRERAEVQRGLRKTPSSSASVATAESQPPSVTKGKSRVRPSPPQKAAPRFGGRATAGGVNYEARVAALIGVKMLAGAQSAVWDGISGADVLTLTMQAPEPVDDVVVSLRASTQAQVFISAKARSGAIALTGKGAFGETVDAFVRQFLRLPKSARLESRLVCAVPDGVGRAITHDLLEVLKEHRDAAKTPFSEFLRGRQKGKKRALDALRKVTVAVWKKHSKHSPAEDELRDFIRCVFVEVFDFSPGQRLLREIEGELRSHVVADPKQARRAWEKLEHFFIQADCHGVPVNAASLRKALTTDGIQLKSPPDFASVIDKLRKLTTQNFTRLREHSTVPFGSQVGDRMHIPRDDEFSALVAAAKAGHLLVTGEPGCGKSGLIHDLVGRLTKDGLPVILLLAEDNPPTLSHPLDEIVANWTDGVRGFFITDALDAVRDVERQRAFRQLLHDIKQSGWTVIASVREFDLKHSRELRELFPGSGITGFSSDDFTGVAHFHVPRLSEAHLDELTRKRPEIQPFIEAARKSAKSGAIHRSPFHLRLAAELLRAGVSSARLADWHSPAILMRKFWQIRFTEGAGTGDRENALNAVSRQMVNTRRMVVSLKQLSLPASERDQIDELRSRGILQSPAIRQGTQVGGDEVRFTHHLLHDYAIARSLIPETPDSFCDFAISELLLPIFYRQSFMFALEELWDASDGRKGFWQVALRLESVPQLHGVARILAPILAARRVESLADVQPLLSAVGSVGDTEAAGQKALQHLASGLQDVDPAVIRSGASGWCDCAQQLSNLLPQKAWIEGPLVHIIARLNGVAAAFSTVQRQSLNAAARNLLANHVAKDVPKGWRYAAMTASEAICRTFDVASTETEHALLSLLAPERLAKFPHNDLYDLADNLKHLRSKGRAVVLRLFETAFATEPQPGQWEQFGSVILPMQVQSSDQWNMIHYILADYYEKRTGDDAALMTEAACIAWNAVVRRRGDRRDRDEYVLASIEFRGTRCDLLEDYSHIWGRDFEHEENRILSHFEKLLREWAAAGDAARLNAALDAFARRNRTSLMWSVFMEAGAAYPKTLGVLLADILNESIFLTHADYAYGAAALLRALHETGNTADRERLERFVLELPQTARLHENEPREPTPSWVVHAQNRLLGVLKEPNIVLASLRDMWRERQANASFPANRRPEGPRVISHTLTAEELVEEKGVSLQEPTNQEMFRLRQALEPLLGRDDKKLPPAEFDKHWHIVAECERAVNAYRKEQPRMAEELWGHLVSACENIARRASWSASDERWQIIRRILLEASTDPVPHARDDNNERDDWPSWGWPSPRLDASRGLPWLAFRLGRADRAVAAALRRLVCDNSHPLRFNLAMELAVLEKPAPDLMWELIDRFIANESKFSVLDALLRAMDWLWRSGAKKIMSRLKLIAERSLPAPAENGIHETLAHVHLFHFLRTGDAESEEFIRKLITDCDSERAFRALSAQLHSCRAGGWLTAGDAVSQDAHADAVRARTWKFFSELLEAAQAELKTHREAWVKLHEHGQQDAEAAKPVKEKLDRATRLVDAVAMQLYFASGAFADRNKKEEKELTPPQLRRFWNEASPLLNALASEMHPHTAHHIVQTLYYLLPYAPREVFLIATESIQSSAKAGFQHESLAVGDVVKLIQRALADHREIFQSHSECLSALLDVLDLFVEAGWSEARQLTHRLEEIYR